MKDFWLSSLVSKYCQRKRFSQDRDLMAVKKIKKKTTKPPQSQPAPHGCGSAARCQRVAPATHGFAVPPGHPPTAAGLLSPFLKSGTRQAAFLSQHSPQTRPVRASPQTLRTEFFTLLSKRRTGWEGGCSPPHAREGTAAAAEHTLPPIF